MILQKNNNFQTNLSSVPFQLLSLCHQAAGQTTGISCSYQIKPGFLILAFMLHPDPMLFLMQPLCSSNTPQRRPSASTRSASEGHGTGCNQPCLCSLFSSFQYSPSAASANTSSTFQPISWSIISKVSFNLSSQYQFLPPLNSQILYFLIRDFVSFCNCIFYNTFSIYRVL